MYMEMTFFKEEKMKKRNLIASLFGVLAVFCSVMAVGNMHQPTVKAAENVFEMVSGGSIRITEPTGLRFRVKMSEDVKSTADKVGMLIFPADYLVDDGTEGDVYYKSVEALAATAVSGHRIDLDLTKKLYNKDGYWYGNGAIVNIKDKNMTREFVGIAYYEADGKTVWADTAQLANTTRSVSEVALLAHADDTNKYSAETDELFCDYIGYIKDENLEKVKLNAIPLFVDNGADTAKSYWKAEYVAGGVKITVNVQDEAVSVDDSSKGYSDNIELQMQAVDNLWHTTDYTFNFLCDASGRYWARRWSDSSYSDISLSNDPTVKNDELYYVFSTTEDGYQVEVFVSYEILNVTEAEGKGNVRICPMLRNRTSESYNTYKTSDLLGCYYHVPATWFVLNESNQFTRPDLAQFTLASRNSEATGIIDKLALLQAEDGGTMAKTELGAHLAIDSNWCLDGIARDLLGTDYLLTGSTAGKATVSESGYVIICVRENNTTLIEKLKNANWTLLADKCRTAIGTMAGSGVSCRWTTSYYAKYCEAGETIETTGFSSLVFGKSNDSTPEAVYKTTPAYISFEAVNEAFYMEEGNVENCCPSVAVTNGGRLYTAYMTGGKYEPLEENCGIMQYSDDGGKTWNRLFVLDTWDGQAVGGTKQMVCFDVELRSDPETNVVYVIYNLRKNINDGITLDAQSWMFTISNPDSTVMTEEGLKISEHWNTNIGFARNGFTILKNGNFIIVPNGTEHSEENAAYISEDKGKTWKVVGSVYVPQAINFDEPIVVEKLDGSLWCTFRTTTGYMCESFSYDGGRTWSIGRETNVKNPASRFSINRLASGKLMMVYSDQSSYRIGMMVAISEDDGKTWENKLCLYDGYASYPVVALDHSSGEEVIHIVFDDGRYYANQWRTGTEDGKKYEYYASIYHVALTEEEIMAGGDPGEEETELLIMGDSYTNSRFWLGFEGSFGTYGGETIGINGSRVADWNTEAMIAKIVAKNPKNLFINLGINDIGAGTDGETVGNAIVAYLETLKSALPNTKIYYNMIVYPSNTNYDYAVIDASNSIVEAYIDADAEDNVNKIDIREKLMRMGEADARRFTDGLHMTAEAYAILCEAIKDETGIGRKVETLNIVSRLRKRIYEYKWTDWEDCGIRSDAPTRYNVRGYAAEEGVYINAVQYVDHIVSMGDKWNEQTHLEAQIWQGNMGNGWDSTYAAFWLDGTTWFNNSNNLGTVKNHVTITDRGEDYADGYRYEISYEIFIPFANNVGSADGPYAYIQFKHHMPGETEEGFEYSYREFRDNARYLWQDDCNSYEFRKTGIVKKYDDDVYKNLGTISGTGVAAWDLNVYRAPSAFYVQVSTTDTIDPSVETGVEFYMNLGEITQNRTQNTYKFQLAMKNGKVTGNVYHYPNGTMTKTDLSYVGRSYKETSGKTTMCLMIPYDSFGDSVDTESIGVTFTSYRGSANVGWTYSGCSIYLYQPIKYLTVTKNNQVYLLGEESIQATMAANGVLQEGYENVFENLALISANTGEMSTIVNGGLLFDDRTTQNFVFETDEAKFLEGKSYVYTGIAEGSFTVEKSGYVFLLLPGTSGYASVRTAAEADGWKKQFTGWNKMGSLSDPVSYYVKWCEAGESYSYGKWNIAVAGIGTSAE